MYKQTFMIMKKITLIAIMLWISGAVYSQQVKETSAKRNLVSVSKSKPVKAKQTPEQRHQYFVNKKNKYISWNTESFRSQNNIPADFPKFIDTGNTENDVRNFEISVKRWIDQNPEEHKKIQQTIGI